MCFLNTFIVKESEEFMLERIKLFIKRKRCIHDMQLTRWHWVHFLDNEPASIESEYKCIECGKIEYLHLYDKEAKQWELVMGNYLKI